MIIKYSRKLLCVLLCFLSVTVIWSEMTFFNKKPILSLVALFLDISRKNYNFLAIEVTIRSIFKKTSSSMLQNRNNSCGGDDLRVLVVGQQ